MLITFKITVIIIILLLPFIVWFLYRGATSNQRLSVYLHHTKRRVARPELKHKKFYRRYRLLFYYVVVFLFFSCFWCYYDMLTYKTMYGYMYDSHKWW